MAERDGVAVTACDRCQELAGSRTRIVNGYGPRKAKIAFVGQGPGREEDRRARPFIGPAGTTARQWVQAAGLSPDRDVFWTNATRCIGPKDAQGKERDPTEEEIAACHGFLMDELRWVDPDLIVVAGAVALQSLYEKAPITQLRGAVLWHEELGKRMVPILHPASAFHVWSNERYGVADLQKAAREARHPDEMPEGLGHYRVCLDVESVELLAEEIGREADVLALDSETTGLDWQTERVLCVGLCWRSGEAYAVPVLGEGVKEMWSSADKRRVLDALHHIFESPIPKIGQNIRFDQLFLSEDLGIELNKVAFDTMLAYHLFHEEEGHSLATLCNLYTNMGDYEREVRQYKKNMAACPLDARHRYQCADADCTMRVALVLDDMLEGEPDLRWVFENITMPLSEAAMHMERRGVLVDMERAEGLVETYDALVAAEKEKLYALPDVPSDFNYRSDPQKRRLLFDVLGLPESGIVTDKKRLPSVGAEALKTIGLDKHPILPILKRLSGLEQIEKTFLKGAKPEEREKAEKGLLNRISRVDNRLHTNYRVDGTSSGRMSHSPNLANVVGEEKSEEGAAVRAIFIAPPGRSLLVADFSQIELRAIAYLAGDEQLIELLESGADIHEFAARCLFDVPDDTAVTSEQRKNAKPFNFGLGYGLTEEGLMRRLGCSKKRAGELLSMYFTRIAAKLPDYFAKQRRIVKRTGVVPGIFGRRRTFWGVQTMKHFGGYRRQMGHIYRESYNFPPQNAGSDIHSLATIALDHDDWLADNGAWLIGSIHDSAMMEINTDQAEEVARHVQKLMQNTAYESTARLGRPWIIPVEVEVGPRWGEPTHKLTVDGEWVALEEAA